MHVLKRMAWAMGTLAVATKAFDAPKEFGDYKNWLENAPFEEKYEHFHDLSESYIERHGEQANKLRLCINLD